MLKAKIRELKRMTKKSYEKKQTRTTATTVEQQKKNRQVKQQYMYADTQQLFYLIAQIALWFKSMFVFLLFTAAHNLIRV